MRAEELVELWGTRYEAKTALEIGDSDVGEAAGGLARRGVTIDRAAAAGGSLVGPYDLVVLHVAHGSGRAPWEESVRAAAQLASKVVVVFSTNPSRLFGGDGPPTEEIAPLLWELGRVREHVYLACPAALELAPERVRRRFARVRAFVIDRTPRTPQERRRRLKQVPGP